MLSVGRAEQAQAAVHSGAKHLRNQLLEARGLGKEINMFTPEEFRAYSQRLDGIRNPKMSLKRLLPYVVKGMALIFPVIALAAWSEVSYRSTSDLENPTVYLCILYLVFVGFWAVPKLKKMRNEMIGNLPVCPFCETRMHLHTIRLVMISDRCPDCGRTIISPSLKGSPDPVDRA
ncbi:Unannotated [Lentimonas sp. CC19]|nr:Unannotated [Lentimonas sp. CC19]CAA7071548.1 Unannotated [Lentimonas sp. CC11]